MYKLDSFLRIRLYTWGNFEYEIKTFKLDEAKTPEADPGFEKGEGAGGSGASPQDFFDQFRGLFKDFGAKKGGRTPPAPPSRSTPDPIPKSVTDGAIIFFLSVSLSLKLLHTSDGTRHLFT